MPNGTDVSQTKPTDNAVAMNSDTAIVRARVISLMEAIPFAEDDPHGITTAILDADNWEAFADGSSSLPKAELVAGLKLKINDVTRRDSDIQAQDEYSLNLPWYIVVDSTNTQTGDKVLWQTSAETIVVKLCKLYSMHKLPAHVILSKAAKATKRGFFPINMTIESVTP